MKPAPMIVMTAHDAVDDDCGCETCTTHWGVEPLPVTVLEAPPAAQETVAHTPALGLPLGFARAAA